jgi:type I restriction enzyme, R subunit
VIPQELDKWLFNKDTTIKTLRFFLKNCITVGGGDEPGKTIFFARSIKHANFLKDMFLELDKEMFGNDYVKVIVNGEPKAEEFLQRFCDDEKDHLPQIAISVDMLDTGIDAPKVVNLVFYKPVKSYTKFWQMIGRGSRLRKHLFGQNQDKKNFLIFDLCGNFNFFDENPEEIKSNSQISLTALVFNTKLHLAQYLGDKRFRDNPEYLDYRKALLDEMYKDVSLLDKDRFEVRMKMEMVIKYGNNCRELWSHLDRSHIKEIKENISALIKPPKGEDNSARFYDRLLYILINKRAEAGSIEQFIIGNIKQIKRIAKISKNLLEKTSIPQIREKENILRDTLDELFWKKDGINHLEMIRKKHQVARQIPRP